MRTRPRGIIRGRSLTGPVASTAAASLVTAGAGGGGGVVVVVVVAAMTVKPPNMVRKCGSHAYT
jgi:hypothetical protein